MTHPSHARRQATDVVQVQAARMARLGPPMLSGPLPAAIELPRQTDFRTLAVISFGLGVLSLGWLLTAAWNEGLFERAENEPLGEYLGYLLELAQSAWLLLPLLFFVGAVAFNRMRRNPQDWLRISLSTEEAQVEGAGGAWRVPVADFTAVALRTRAGFSMKLTNQTTTNVVRGILPGQQYSILGRETLWWVELIHPDPERSVPVWASDAPNAEATGRRVAVSVADRLGLPIDLPERATATG